jgi:pyroglutamyl-peptidase
VLGKHFVKKIILTAFESFNNRLENQSQNVLKALLLTPQHVTAYLPVVFEQSFHVLNPFIQHHKPHVIIALGEGPQPIPQIEHFAVNMMHARIPDNHGYQPELTKISTSSSTTLTGTIDFEKLADFLNAKGVSFQHSFHAGTYVCNDLYYRMLDAKLASNIVFVHVSHEEQYFQKSLETIQCLLTFFSELE